MMDKTDETGCGTSLTVYHDGACPLCAWEISHYRKQAGAERIDFVDVSRPEADTGPDLSRQVALGRFYVRDARGQLHSGAAGFAALWQHLPRFQWLGRLAGLPGLRWLLEGLYRAFLPLRPALARFAGRRRSKRSSPSG